MRDYFDISGVLETTEFEIAQVALSSTGKWYNVKSICKHCQYHNITVPNADCAMTKTPT